MSDSRIPPSHTRYSWLCSNNQPPIGHTKFSWGIAGQRDDLTDSRSATAGEEQAETEKPAVKRGFLNSGTAVKELVDVKQFLSSKVPTVLKKASELHIIEDDEKTPFKSKYEARELLKAVMTQLQNCHDRLDHDLRESWSDSIARTELMLGNNFVETEELSQGEKFLNSAVDRMRQNPGRFESEVLYVQVSIWFLHA